MTTNHNPEPIGEQVTVKGRECHFTDYGGYVRITDAPFGQAVNWLWSDGEWHADLDHADSQADGPAKWKTEDAARAFLASIHSRPAPQAEGEPDRELFEERAFAQRFLMSIRRNPSPPTPKISGALDFVSMDCPYKVDFVRRDEKGNYLDSTLDAMWWAWQESRKAINGRTA